MADGLSPRRSSARGWRCSTRLWSRSRCPGSARSFHSGVSALQWVVTSYTLTLAAFLLLGGTLGDRYGRRRVFAIGVVWFAIASAACAAHPTAGTLIAARALQGVGAALLTPGSLAILQSAFVPDDRVAGDRRLVRARCVRPPRPDRWSVATCFQSGRGDWSSSSTCRLRPWSWRSPGGMCPSRPTAP